MNAEYNINGKIIETERLILRPFKDTDLDDFYAYASVEGIGEMAGWHHHENKEESATILKSFIDEDKIFAICLKDSGRVVGSLDIEFYTAEDKLTEFDGYKGREIGYDLAKDQWGKGIMPEAVQAVINYMFDEIDLDFLMCGYFNKNNQSNRVQEKCGFKPYRSLVFNTKMGTKEPGVLSLLINPAKNIRFNFSHPETLIWKD